MKIYHKVIIELLRAAINNEKLVYSSEDEINWSEVINEANAHNVGSLIYSAINPKSFKFIDKKLIDDWKREVFICNIAQIKNIENTKKVISDLENQGVKVIILKGLVVREYYPLPELRTMCDADLLIYKSDCQKVKD